MRSADWVRSAGKATLGAAVVAAPVGIGVVAGAGVQALEATPAGASWVNGHCYNNWIGLGIYSTEDCISKSTAASHAYKGTFQYNNGFSEPSRVWGHVEVAVGSSVYNTNSQYIKAGTSPVRDVTGKYKGSHYIRIWVWLALHSGSPLGSYGYTWDTF